MTSIVRTITSSSVVGDQTGLAHVGRFSSAMNVALYGSAGSQTGKGSNGTQMATGGRRSSKNRLRHLLTTGRGRSRRSLMTVFSRPWAASNTILGPHDVSIR